MELVAGILGIALFAVVSRTFLTPAFVHGVCMSAGIAMYAAVQQLYSRWTEISGVVAGHSSIVRIGIILGIGMALALLLLVMALPFTVDRRREFESAIQRPIAPPSFYVLFWLGGAILSHFLVVAPVWERSGAFWRWDDWPLPLYECVLLLLLVLQKLRDLAREERLAHAEAMTTEGDPEGNVGFRLGPTDLAVEDDRRLEERLAAIRLQAENAERRWAAAVLQERAARIKAEQFARDFADARKPGSYAATAVEEDRDDISLSDAYRILRLVPGCTPAAAREAYHQLMVKYHPDRVNTLGSEIRNTAEREARRINLAYAMIKRRFPD